MARTTPFFSIVIPTLNEEKYLPVLLESLGSQGFRNFEVIIVDGHSEDKTIELAAKFVRHLPKLTILNSDIRNVSVQRNTGGLAAIGKYVVFVDADSAIPNYFLSGLHYRLESKRTDVFTCWCRADEEDALTDATINIINLFIETARLLETPVAMGSLIGVKSEIFKRTKGFDPEVSFAEDTEFVSRLFKEGHLFRVFRDPRFVFNLRRFKKKGTLKVFRQYANLHLKRLLGIKIDQEKEYPMGGVYPIEDKQTRNLLEVIIKTFDAGQKIPHIAKKLKAILTLTEEED